MRDRLSHFYRASALLLACTPCLGGDDAGPFVRALWLVQHYGVPDAVQPQNDQKTKGKLFKALGKGFVLKPEGVKGLLEPATFTKLAGADHQLDAAEIRKLVETDQPESRMQLHPKTKAHAEQLTTSFDMIDAPHREGGEKLATWIMKNYKPGEPLHVTVVCTGNSRRSILGSTMGNIAAAFYGMPEVRFHSGGTAPTAFNPRTIAALSEIGVEITPTGAEAARGDAKTANPIYTVKWGSNLESTEFSKTYFDAANPQKGFAALMVCSEADEGCPLVKGAALRVSMPYLDPKIFDDSPYESQKYAERRDDIGRLMLCVMMQARNQLSRTER